MDKEFAEMIEAYFHEGFLEATKDDFILPLRTIPVNQALDPSYFMPETSTIAPF